MTDSMPLAPPTSPIDDVFDFCNHVAWQAGGPVLIHDSAWGVVAYSTLPQTLDEGRRAIILRRSVPNSQTERDILDFAQRHFDTGVESFEIPAHPGIQGRRVVAPVRMLGVHVGSIWIAESAGPLHPDALAIARQAAKEASLYFQLSDDTRRRESDRFARMILEGSQEEGLLAQYLGVPATTPFRVVVAWHGASPEAGEAMRALARDIAAGQPVPSIALDCDQSVCLAFYSPDGSEVLRQATRSFARQLVDADASVIVGGGRITTRLAHVPKSKADADKVVAYLRANPGERAGSSDTLRTQITLMRLVEILESQFEAIPDVLRPLAMLEDDDRDEALRTLDAYFSHPGNASDAARELHIHPNTFRYRIAKVADLLDVDLEDRDERVILELGLLRHRYNS